MRNVECEGNGNEIDQAEAKRSNLVLGQCTVDYPWSTKFRCHALLHTFLLLLTFVVRELLFPEIEILNRWNSNILVATFINVETFRGQFLRIHFSFLLNHL